MALKTDNLTILMKNNDKIPKIQNKMLLRLLYTTFKKKKIFRNVKKISRGVLPQRLRGGPNAVVAPHTILPNRILG